MEKSRDNRLPNLLHEPLSGKTVVVTRAPAQSNAITLRLEELGATVIHCPMIEIAPPENWASLDASIRRIETYDWIIFTSANAANFFFRRLSELRGPGSITLRGIVICAIGPATSEALTMSGVTAHLVASDSTAEGVLSAIIEYIGGRELVHGLSFLMPRGRLAREFLPDSLRALGASVDAVETYQTIRPDSNAGDIVSVLRDNSIDAITFTSPSTVVNFVSVVGTQNLPTLLKNALVGCIGPITAETAAKYGLPRIIQPKTYTSGALVDIIVEHLGTDS